MSKRQSGDIDAFGRLLADAIARAGFPNPTALARQAGLSPSVLTRAVNGANVPSVATLRAIAPLLGIPEAELIAAAYPDGEPVELPDTRPRLSRDRATGTLLDAGGRELIPEIADIIDLMGPYSGLDKEGREAGRKLLYGVVMTLAQLAGQTREVGRLTGARDYDPGVEVPDQGTPHYLDNVEGMPESVDVTVQLYQPRESTPRGARRS